jgi:c-di-GMP-binding flagellar brake protein YcgR
MYPKVNESIIVDIPVENNAYFSIIAEVRNEDILITCPIVSGLFQIIPLETPIEITYIMNGDRFKFHSQIIERIKDNIPLYRIQKPKQEEIIRVQNRDNFRVLAALKVKIKQKEFTTMNISGGGLLFLCQPDFELKEEEIVSGSLFIPTSSTKVVGSIQFEAKVVRISSQENTNMKNVGISYTKIDEKQRKKIIQYCFQKQREEYLMERE